MKCPNSVKCEEEEQRDRGASCWEPSIALIPQASNTECLRAQAELNAAVLLSSRGLLEQPAAGINPQHRLLGHYCLFLLQQRTPFCIVFHKCLIVHCLNRETSIIVSNQFCKQGPKPLLKGKEKKNYWMRGGKGNGSLHRDDILCMT